MVDVIIIGGGLSGLSAAVDLARRGIHGILLEQGPKLGGRCYSYRDKLSGDIVDNGQHVLLGAYHNLLDYLEVTGTRQFLGQQPALRLPMYHPSRGIGTFRIPSLPKPIHLTAAMLQYNLLPLRDRQRLLKVGFFLNRWNAEKERHVSSLTIKQWFDDLHQSAEAQRCLWNPIAVSVMNELPEKAAALPFVLSLRAAFLGKKSDSAMLFPTVGQTELYVDGALDFLRNHHLEVLMNSEVERITVAGGKVSGVRLSDGSMIESRTVISTVPYYALKKLIPVEYHTHESFASLDALSSSPIISLHLWFDKEFMEHEYIGLIGKTIQWLFNRRRIIRGDQSNHSYLSAVISGAYDYIDLSKEQLVAMVLNDIHEVYPASRNARLSSSIVIKEKRATFSSTVDNERLRPSTRTTIDHFYLAGDWTATGLPATIEGAVKSGFTAARIAVEALQ